IATYFVGGFLATDLTVSAITTDGGWLETPMASDVVDELMHVPGVRNAETLRILPGQLFRGERIALAAVSDGLYDPARFPSGWYRAGDPQQVAEAVRSGRGVNVSTTLVDRYALRLGDDIELD